MRKILMTRRFVTTLEVSNSRLIVMPQPLKVIQDELKKELSLQNELKRESSQRVSSKSGQPLPPPPKAKPPVDLFDDVPAPPLRPSTTDTPGIKPPPSQTATAPKPTKTSDSLLGLNDIFGAPPQPATSVRPSSSTSTPSESAASSRIVLKNSILALYSQPAKSQQQTQQQLQHPVGSMQPSSNQAQSSLGGLSNSFNDLSFQNPISTPTPASMTQTQPKSDPFASFSTAAAQRSSAAPPKITPAVLTGQGFFDQKSKSIPKQSVPSKPPTLAAPKIDSLLSDDFGSFSSPSSTTLPTSNPATNKSSNDLFDFSEPSARIQAPPPVTSTPIPPPKSNSIFNLSTPAPAPQPAAKVAAAPPQPTAKKNSSFSNIDAWGSSDAWATPESTTATTAAPQQKPITSAKLPSIPMSNDFSAWGAPPIASNNQASALSNGFANGSQAPPRVAPDEDFGGWSSAAPATPAVANPPTQQNKPTGFSDDFGGWNSAAPVTPAVANAPIQQSKSAGFGEDFGGWNSTAPITPAVKDPPPQPSKPAGGANGFGGGDDLFSNVWE